MSEEEKIKNDLIEGLLNSDIEENRVFGSLLLNSDNIPEREREVYIDKIIGEFIANSDRVDNPMILDNVIKAYGNLSRFKKTTNRIKRI